MRRRHHPLNLVRGGLVSAHRFDGASALPAWFALARVIGPASWQTAPAVDGQTFVAYDAALAANTARHSYHRRAGRLMLLVEGARTNQLPNSNFVDAGVNEVPDGWTIAAGAAGVDFSCEAGGPHGGLKFRYLDTGVLGRGVYDSSQNLVAATTYSYSVWNRTTGAGAVAMRAFELTPGLATYTLPAGPYDWRLDGVVAATIGDAPGLEFGYMEAHVSDPPGLLDNACPQVEAGNAPSLWIPTSGGAGTRGAEDGLCASDVCGVHGGEKGAVEFFWSPFGYGSTHGFDVGNVILGLTTFGNEIQWNWGTQRLIFYHNGFGQSVQLAATFSAMDLCFMRATWGPEGTTLMAVNLTTGQTWSGANGTAWTPVTLSPRLGSRSGAPGHSHYFGDVRFYER